MKKGFSLIGMLLTLIIIGILLKLMIAPYKQAATKPGQAQHIQTQSQAKQTVDNVRAQLKQAEQAAHRRANAFENGNY